MRKYVIPILGATVIIVLIITVFKVTAKKVSESPFETQAVETASAETQPEIVIHNEGEDKVNIDDLDVSVDTPTYETIGTTEIVETDSNGNETVETIGVVETEAYGGFVGVDENGDTVVGFNSIPLSSGHQYTDIELLYVDNLISEYMADEALGEEFINQRLNLQAFDGLSDTDKAEIKSTLLADHPHNSAVGTSEENTETVPETTVADSETESVVYESAEASDENYSDVDVYKPTGDNLIYGENSVMPADWHISEEGEAYLRSHGLWAE